MLPAVAAPALPSALNALPTAAAVAVLCVAVIAEIVAVPGVLLPGGTVTLLAGALIGAGRPALGVAVPVVAAVIGGDQLAYASGAAVLGWWRRRRPGQVADARPPGQSSRRSSRRTFTRWPAPLAMARRTSARPSDGAATIRWRSATMRSS